MGAPHTERAVDILLYMKTSTHVVSNMNATYQALEHSVLFDSKQRENILCNFIFLCTQWSMVSFFCSSVLLLLGRTRLHSTLL